MVLFPPDDRLSLPGSAGDAVTITDLHLVKTNLRSSGVFDAVDESQDVFAFVVPNVDIGSITDIGETTQLDVALLDDVDGRYRLLVWRTEADIVVGKNHQVTLLVFQRMNLEKEIRSH